MKKTMMTLAILMIVCILSAFALTACNIDLENADYTEDYEATNKEGTVELVTAFFEETLKDPNFVVTGKKQGRRSTIHRKRKRYVQLHSRQRRFQALCL